MGFINLIKLLWSSWLLPMLESLPTILQEFKTQGKCSNKQLNIKVEL